MKIGIIYTAYNAIDYVAASLAPWIAAREQGLDGHEYVICVVNVPFAGFPNEAEDGTQGYLQKRYLRYEIDGLITEPKNIPETTARGMALTILKEKGCDIVWQIDADEFYHEDEISSIVRFVEANPFTIWFRLSLKNYVFDPFTYLVEPFTPPRIHRVKADRYQVHSFSQDNDIAYGGTITRDIIDQSRFPSMTIPQEIAWVNHLTWQSNLRSKRKIQYQLEGRGWPQCSFVWDNERNCLAFNPNLPTPRTAQDVH